MKILYSVEGAEMCWIRGYHGGYCERVRPCGLSSRVVPMESPLRTAWGYNSKDSSPRADIWQIVSRYKIYKVAVTTYFKASDVLVFAWDKARSLVDIQTIVIASNDARSWKTAIQYGPKLEIIQPFS
jgi:hypothetical protein